MGSRHVDGDLMSASAILIDVVALLFAVLGFLVAFQSERVRNWWAITNADGARKHIARPMSDDEPARYVMRIVGVMMLAFGTAIFLFVTIFHFASVSAAG